MEKGLGKAIGMRIKRLRESRGLTQLQLAELMGKSVETISNFERGKVMTSLYTLAQISRHLRVSITDFFDEADILRKPDRQHPLFQKVQNAIDCLPDDDLMLVLDFISMLENRHRRSNKE